MVTLFRFLATCPIIQPLVEFLYRSGWRRGEVIKLEWRDVHLSGKVVRLRIEDSKNKEARILPLSDRLWEIIQDRARVRRLDCPAEFHHDGYEIGGFKNSWATACKKSRLERNSGPRFKTLRCSQSLTGRRTGGSSNGDHRSQDSEHVPALPDRR